jgi:hypothetical protein
MSGRKQHGVATVPTQTDTSLSQRWERPFPTTPGYWKQQLATKYLALAGRADLVALRQLLAQHPDWLNKRGPHNRTLLWEATRRGKLTAVRWLVEQGAELDATGCYNSESYVQLTPFCAALYYHRTDIATYLRTQGTQLDIFRAAWLGDLPGVSQALDEHPALLQAEDPYDTIYNMCHCSRSPWPAGTGQWSISCSNAVLWSAAIVRSCCILQRGRRAWI